jgi:HSP20 family protein
MNNEETTKLATTEPKPNGFPAFVEAEKMFDRMADITRETAARAFDYFMSRGGMFGTRFDDWLKAESEILRPTPVEITETKDMVNLKAAVPGFKPNEIEISIKDNDLIMSGERNVAEKNEDENTFYSEWHSNRFFRKLTLPSDVETEGVTANLKDGILTMSLTKKAAEEAAKIKVQTA